MPSKIHIGPEPMENLKPSEKRKNAAENFKDLHEAEYKSREDDERRHNPRDYINNRNQWPKLEEELKTKKTTKDVKAIAYYCNNPNCKGFRSIVTRNGKYNGKQTIHKGRRRAYGSKTRSKFGHRLQDQLALYLDNLSNTEDKSCQCASVPNSHSGSYVSDYYNSAECSKNYKSQEATKSKSCRVLCQRLSKVSSGSRSGRRSSYLTVYPDSDRQSQAVSSYHSFKSTNNEPME